MGMDQKPWIFGEKDPNEDVSPGDYLDSKKAFVMEQLNLTSDSQYESLKKDSLEEFEKMLAKEKGEQLQRQLETRKQEIAISMINETEATMLSKINAGPYNSGVRNGAQVT